MRVQRVVQEIVDQRPRPVLYIYPNEKAFHAEIEANPRSAPARVRAIERIAPDGAEGEVQ